MLEKIKKNFFFKLVTFIFITVQAVNFETIPFKT